MAQANHSSGEKNNKQFPPVSLKNTDSNRYGGGMSSFQAAFRFLRHASRPNSPSPINSDTIDGWRGTAEGVDPLRIKPADCPGILMSKPSYNVTDPAKYTGTRRVSAEERLKKDMSYVPEDSTRAVGLIVTRPDEPGANANV